MTLRRTIAAAFALGALAGAAWAADPFDGTWELDRGKAAPGSGTQTLDITVRGDQETYLTEFTNGRGQRTITAYVVPYTGKRVPSHNYTMTANGEISYRQGEVSAVLEGPVRIVTHFRDGRTYRILRRTAAADGGSLKSEMTDLDAEGKVINTATLVFVRKR